MGQSVGIAKNRTRLSTHTHSYVMMESSLYSVFPSLLPLDQNCCLRERVVGSEVVSPFHIWETESQRRGGIY